MLVAKTAQFPSRVQLGEEVENILVQKRIANLHRGVHRYAVAFCLQQVPSQGDPRGNPDSAIQRMPAAGALEIELKLGPRVALLQDLPHRRCVEAKFREREQTISIDPGVRPTNCFLRSASHPPRKLRDIIQSQVGATRQVAQPHSGNDVQEPEKLGRFIPGIADQPLIGSFSGENDLLTAGINPLRQHQQSRA